MTDELIKELKKEISIFLYIQKAESHFIRRDYNKALFTCFDILYKDPNDSQAQIIVLLIQVAGSNEAAAQELFELYLKLQMKKHYINIKEIILDKIDDLAIESAKLSMFLKSLKHGLFTFQDGISYSDFKDFAVKNKGFERAFQDVNFSSKIIIETKDELIDLIDNLIDYGFNNKALNYLNEGLKIFPKDYQLNLLAKMMFNKTKKEKL